VATAGLRRHDTTLPDGRRRNGWHNGPNRVRFPATRTDFETETRAEHTLDPADPASAATRYEHRMRYDRDGWHIEVTGTAEVRCTSEAYRLTGSVTVSENDRVIFERRWSPEIPRTCS